MTFITARLRVRHEHADDRPRLAATSTDGTRAEPGCLFKLAELEVPSRA